MLLVQSRKFGHAASDQDHAKSHPASWQPFAQEAPAGARTSRDAAMSNISKSSLATLTLEQLQELSVHISDRIQIKKRYNNTPLRRILTRQVSSAPSSTSVRSEEDTFSQTDTLVNSEVLKIPKESAESIQRRYNNTPLRRILARQTSTEQSQVLSQNRSDIPHREPESLEVRKARYNNTPLRRILSHQSSNERSEETSSNTVPSPLPSSRSVSSPVPRSNTPLRRILSRQTSAQIETTPPRQKDDDEFSDRADSVISSESPTVYKSFTPHPALVDFTSESRIRAYETALWDATKPITSPAACWRSQPETKIRQYEEEIWAKNSDPITVSKPEENRRTTVTVTELSVDAKMPKRIVVDSKGSPLRRILQRQTSRDWRALQG